MKKSDTLRDEIKDLKRKRILDAASELFFQHGFNGTSVEAIASRLHVTKPFIYYHFENKADILAGVCGRTTAFVAQSAEVAAAGSGSVWERLQSLVRDLCLRVIEGRVYLAVYFREENHLPKSAFRDLSNNRRRFDTALSKLLREGVDAGEFHIPNVSVATQAITGMTTWVFNWYRPTGALTPDQIAEEMVSLVSSMVGRPSRKAGRSRALTSSS
ncbi:MAG: TetR family transcriptional regulator [Rhizobiales bacterium]|nr:TetR family transcriptional regulator [Hyphomicrobiales bacterium]